MPYLVIIIGLVLSFPLLMLRKAFETNVRHHDIELSTYHSQKPFRILFISDIHCRKITERFISQIDSEIEAVIIGGDLAERGVPLKRVQENINQLAKIGPLYYVWGNNDREVGEQHIKNFIQHVGGEILDNKSICLKFHQQPIWLVGIDDVSKGRADIEKSFANVPKEDTIIFISHSPFVFNTVKEQFHSNVLLAGHTHGGQIRLGKWGYYKIGSIKKRNDEVTLISNGYGTTGIPLRFGAPAECHILSIKKNSINA